MAYPSETWPLVVSVTLAMVGTLNPAPFLNGRHYILLFSLTSWEGTYKTRSWNSTLHVFASQPCLAHNLHKPRRTPLVGTLLYLFCDDKRNIQHSVWSLHKCTGKAEPSLGFFGTNLRKVAGNLHSQELMLSLWVIGSHEGINFASQGWE